MGPVIGGQVLEVFQKNKEEIGLGDPNGPLALGFWDNFLKQQMWKNLPKIAAPQASGQVALLGIYRFHSLSLLHQEAQKE